MNDRAAKPAPDASDWVADRHGEHVLLRRRGAGAGKDSLIGWPPPVPGQVFVLVSPDAAPDSSLIDVLPSLLLRHVVAAGVDSVRIGLPGLGKDPVVPQALADVLKVDLFAPDGAFLIAPGAALYAGHPAAGWRRFRPNLPPVFGGLRHPVPQWEPSMPASPVSPAGAVAEPVPAGVYVRDTGERAATMGDKAFAVPVDPTQPKVVVGQQGSVPGPAATADVVRGLATGPLRLVPLTAEPLTHAWLAEFTKFLGRDVTVATVGSLPYRPFATVLRQRADGGQEVVEALAPPPGWTRSGPRTYRLGDVVADVVPSGLVLGTGPGDSAADEAPFDPEGWTLHLGVPGQPISPDVLTAAETLLDSLDGATRETARPRLVGTLDDRAHALLGPNAVTRVRPPQPAPPAMPRVSRPKPPAAPPSVPPSAAPPLPPAAPPGRRGPVAPPGILVSAAPVPTVSGLSTRKSPPAPANTAPSRPPAGDPPSLRTAGSQPPPPPRPPVDAGATVPELPVTPQRTDESSPYAESATERLVMPTAPPETTLSAPAPAPAAQAKPDPEDQPPDEVDVPAEPEPVPAGPALVIPDRASTNAEQTRFAAAAGEAFGEALATVNAALATWPSMRQENTPGVKADYVAVCLYLGNGPGGAAEVNRAVRTGREASVDGQIPCLASGLRRLPTHRRAVLRQGKGGKSLERVSTPGALLTEPGFLAGSIDLDVTVPGADLDVLIWPASARRTSELADGRSLNEAVFLAGARFKALAVRTAEAAGESTVDGPVAPQVAALFRELAPGEPASSSGDLDEQDLAVLAKLDKVLARRQRTALRVLDDPSVVSRLTTSMVEWDESMAAPAGTGRTATLTS
ncbi:hypothetical protein [Amycolatopsis pigmentata]|uniref:Uncharacterized protein n=1 Tax=Amycolatopsis pigmentata TaxID=450801 RepID=A0ABW5G3R6_9PSEU